MSNWTDLALALAAFGAIAAACMLIFGIKEQSTKDPVLKIQHASDASGCGLMAFIMVLAAIVIMTFYSLFKP